MRPREDAHLRNLRSIWEKFLTHSGTWTSLRVLCTYTAMSRRAFPSKSIFELPSQVQTFTDPSAYLRVSHPSSSYRLEVPRLLNTRSKAFCHRTRPKLTPQSTCRAHKQSDTSVCHQTTHVSTGHL
jgi:hypothetical protein